jgi:hypothetical protein
MMAAPFASFTCVPFTMGLHLSACVVWSTVAWLAWSTLVGLLHLPKRSCIISASTLASYKSSSVDCSSLACSPSSSTSTHYIHTNLLSRHPYTSWVYVICEGNCHYGEIAVMPSSFSLCHFVNPSYSKLFLGGMFGYHILGDCFKPTWFNVLVGCAF